MNFYLEIVTPARSVYNGEVDMLTVPSGAGEIGILARHVPLFTNLVEGEVKVTKGKDEWYLAIGGGFMEVTQSKVTVLVSRAVDASELNEAEIKKAYAQAQEMVKKGGEEGLQAQTLLRRSLLDLKVLGRYRKHSSTLPS